MALGSYFLFQSGVENCLVRDDFFSLSLRVAGYMIRSMSPSPFKGHIFFFSSFSEPGARGKWGRQHVINLI